MNELSRLLNECFSNRGSRLAVFSTEESLSYAQLNDRASQIEKYFQNIGLAQHDCIGLLLPKCPNYVAAIIAAIRLGLTYVPIDFDAPASRSAYILENAGCQVVVTTTERSVTAFENIKAAVITPDLNLAVCQFASLPTKQGAREKFEHAPAYILYTSGSTGQPKGVKITAANAVCFIEWAVQEFGITKDAVVASIAPFHFDLSVFDLFASLKCGAILVLFSPQASQNPRSLACQLAEHKIDTLYATPSLLQLLLRYGKLDKYDFSSLQTVLFAGEVFPVAPLRALKERWSTAKFYNLYGPTETNVVSWHPIPHSIPVEQQAPYPIGRLCPYAKAMLKQGGDYYKLAPAREGELLISGTSVTPGYVGFSGSKKNRFYDIDEDRWYATGDLVYVNSHGELIYQGRIDRMVKRRGYRIELAEIENSLATHPDITSFGAIAIQQDDQTIIVGYYQANASLSLIELKQFLANLLPLYMIPDRFVYLPQMPLTSNHKVDYQYLHKIASTNV